MRAARFCLVTAVIAGAAGCSDDGSVDGELADLPPVVATGHYIGSSQREFADFCAGVDDGLGGCAGARVLVPASTVDVLVAAGVTVAEGDRGEVRSTQPVTLVLDDLSYDAGARQVHAGEVEVLDVEAPRPVEVIDGEGDLDPQETLQGAGAEALDQLAAELGPPGTVYLAGDVSIGTENDHPFIVSMMLPLSDEARQLLIATLSGEILVESWASFAG